MYFRRCKCQLSDCEKLYSRKGAYLRLLKDYIGVLNQAKDYLEIQRIASEALTIDMQNGDIHFYMIRAILDQGNRSVARMQFRQAERFMDDEQIKAIRQRFQNWRASGA